MPPDMTATAIGDCGTTIGSNTCVSGDVARTGPDISDAESHLKTLAADQDERPICRFGDLAVGGLVPEAALLLVR